MEENVFRVNFPSKIELVRVQHFGRFHVPDSSIILSFDFWKKEIQPAWVPEDVWVRVYGLPPVALDDYLALWALGDVFGKTKDINITFTRQNNVLRMLITCLDTTLIPGTWDLKIKQEFFRLRFEVEGEHITNNPDVTMSMLLEMGEMMTLILMLMISHEVVTLSAMLRELKMFGIQIMKKVPPNHRKSRMQIFWACK
jgi:hypothetical protein